MNNLMVHQGYHSPALHSVPQSSQAALHSLSRAASANEGLTARITGPGTSPHFLAAASGRPAGNSTPQAPLHSNAAPQRSSATEAGPSSALTSATPVPRPLTVHEQDMIAQLDKLKYFLATAPSRWSAPNSSASDALVQHPQTASHPAMNRFLLPSGEFVSCVLWGGLYHITGTDIVRALVFRFEAFARPVRNMKKFEEGVFSDLRNLKPGNDACLEEPKSPFLDLLFKYQCIRTQKKQKVFYWFSVPHDRLFLDALERDLKREKMGLEPTTVVVGEPARSFTYDPKRTLYEQFASSRGEGDELDRAVREAEHITTSVGYSANIPQTVVGASALSGATKVVTIQKSDVEGELLSDVEASPEPLTRSQQSTNAIHHQSGHGKQFFNMLSLFEGSPSYKQRRKKAVKAPRRRMASGGNGTESESEAGVGLRYLDEDTTGGAASGSESTSNLILLQDQHVRGHRELPGSRASSLSHMSSGRQPPYAQDISSQVVAVPSASLRQHQSEAMAGLGNHPDSVVAAPLVSSSLRSDISQQLTDPVAPNLSSQQQYANVYQPTLPQTSGHFQVSSPALIPSSDVYPPSQLQNLPAGVISTKAYVCPLYSCGRLYREPWYLKQHIRSHAVDKPYQCERCFKQFSRTDHLGQHHQTHLRADNGDQRATLDLEQADEDETMLMGEKICEVEVRGEVEDVAGEPGQLRGIGVVCIYPSNTAEAPVTHNPADEYPELASPPPANFPYPNMTPKHSPSQHQWRSHHGGRSVPPVGRWPNDLDSSWDMPRSQSALGYAWEQRSVSPAYSAISAPLSHAPYHRNTADSLRPPTGGYMQSAPSHKQSFDGAGLFHASSSGGVLRRHRSATPFQSHRGMAAALRRTSAGGPDELDFPGATSRYHPYGAASSSGVYSAASSPVPYAQATDPRATSTMANSMANLAAENAYTSNDTFSGLSQTQPYYSGEPEEFGYEVQDNIYDGTQYDTASV
ncbi:transcription factor STEA [Ceratobasidium sp. AG-Ba]|nr:transcription factor STEA [Ceratobasidium sp. AG-Ba]QRV99468.1 transcription factor STEA [Ceratobasidium sp. AG-Ba]